LPGPDRAQRDPDPTIAATIDETPRRARLRQPTGRLGRIP